MAQSFLVRRGFLEPPERVSSMARSSSMSHWPMMEMLVAGASGVVSQKPDAL